MQVLLQVFVLLIFFNWIVDLLRIVTNETQLLLERICEREIDSMYVCVHDHAAIPRTAPVRRPTRYAISSSFG